MRYTRIYHNIKFQISDALTAIILLLSSGNRQPACLKGWKMGIKALLQLWEVLHEEYGIKFLLTNRLNQDCVENLFSVIRAKMGPNDRPDAAQFRIAFGQVCKVIIKECIKKRYGYGYSSHIPNVIALNALDNTCLTVTIALDLSIFTMKN